MILAIDIGNTICKIAVIHNHLIISFSTCDLNDLFNVTTSHLEKRSIHSIALCSVHGDFTEFVQQISQKAPVFQVDQSIKLPFHNKYLSPTLGNDRIALVAGALSIEKTIPEDLLIIDAGTCITYDYIDNDKNYYGGAISPGVYMRFKSLHTFTSKLPLITPESNTPITGNSTETSMRSGVQHGLSMEMDGMINHYNAKSQNLKVFLTGGDADLLSELLKNRFFARPYLMLEGIYNLYLFNNKI
jgi:type III pantothenate kinase